MALALLSCIVTSNAQQLLNPASQIVKVLEARATENIVYKEAGDTKLLMDIYLPKDGNKKEYPAVIYMHGGGWTTGNKSKICNGLHNGVADILLENGIAVISINYRLISAENGVYVSDCISDAKDALAFLNKEGKKYKINSKKIITWGVSAGGHLAMMTGYTENNDFQGDKDLYKERIKPIAVVSWYGGGTFEIKDTDSLESVMKRYEVLHKKFTPSNDWNIRREMALKVSPIEYIDSKDAHSLIMGGDKDTGVKIEQAYFIKDALDKNNVKSEMVVVKNAGHTWTGENISPNLEEIFKITAKFMIEEINN